MILVLAAEMLLSIPAGAQTVVDSGTVTGPLGNASNFSGKTTLNDGAVDHTGTITGPHGEKEQINGLTTDVNGTIDHTATFTNPNGKTETVNSQGSYKNGAWRNSGTITGPAGRRLTFNGITLIMAFNPARHCDRTGGKTSAGLRLRHRRQRQMEWLNQRNRAGRKDQDLSRHRHDTQIERCYDALPS